MISAPTINAWFDSATPADISSYVRGVQITRGRTSPLQDIQAGTCTIEGDNRGRALDIESPLSPFYESNANPLARLNVVAEGVTIFDGDIDDYDHRYPAKSLPVTTITAVDLMAKVAQNPMGFEYTGGAGQSAGSRILSILSLVDLYEEADLLRWDLGVFTLQPDFVPATTNALGYINLVARTELGRFFAARDRPLVFRDSQFSLGSPVLTLADTFAGGTIPFSDVNTISGKNAVHSQVIVSRVGGSTEIFTDEDAKAVYGIISTGSVFTGLLYEDDLQSVSVGTTLISVMADASQRFSRFVVNLGALTVPQRVAVLELDLAAKIEGVYTPTGDGATIVKSAFVEGIRHTMSPGKHVVELLVSNGVS